MPKKPDSRIQTWVKAHQGTAAGVLAIACFAALCTIFYFVVFSDFGGSADFVYNQF
ncbi:MAG: hypothetical protein IJ113_04150 [Eggerthellaceae bacterium]|nr:hypothetical protein [Eggerthellaceae bacterium]